MKKLFDRTVLLINGLALALAVVALVDFILHPLAQDHVFHSVLYRAVAILLLTPLTLLVGFLIRRRVPGNIVGPLLVVWAGSVAYNSIRAEIAPVLFAIFFFYDMAFGWMGLFLMLAHFPDGKIYPPRLEPWVYRLLVVFLPIISLVFLSTPSLLFQSQLPNPFYQPALQKAGSGILLLGVAFLFPILALGVISPVLRYRKGSLHERQQIKWLALSGGFVILYTVPVLIVYPLLTGGELMDPGAGIYAVTFYLTTALFPPLAIGVAILRHHLWDIDFIIRRTIVYSILTSALGLIYFGGVALVQAILNASGGLQTIAGKQAPAIVIVATTLLVAAAFNPLRRKLQEVIDRRFYRQKYNAEQVLDAFSTTLREDVALDHLEEAILKVVEDTMQPERVSLALNKVDAGARDLP